MFKNNNSRKLQPFLFMVLLLGFIQVSINSKAQSVTLSEKNSPLAKVFKEIEKQTGYYFIYRDEWLTQTTKVNVEVKNGKLLMVLDICFRNQPITFTIVAKLIVIKKKTV